MGSVTTADVAVVGNGIIGCTVALELRRRNPSLRITLIGPPARPAGASAAAAAMLGCFGEVSAGTLATDAGRAKFYLSLEAHRLWPDFLDGLKDADPGASDPVRVNGTYVVLNGRSGDLDSQNFRALEEALVAYREPFEFVDSVPGLDPVPDGRPLRAAYLPNEGAVDARGVLARIEKLLRREKVTFVDATVQRIVADAGAVTGLDLEHGEVISAPQVVVAAGAFSSRLLDTVLPPHAVQPVFAGSGLAIVCERVLGTGFSSVVRTVNRAGSCGLHVVPLGGPYEYFGATNVIFAEPENRPHMGVWHFLAQCAMEQLDQMACYSRVDEVRFGNRPVSLDTFPLLGRLGVDGLHLLTGTYRDGFHAAPRIAELAAQEILDGASSFPTILDPMRAPISTLSVDESIDGFAAQMTDSAFESSTRLSRFIHHTELTDSYRARAQLVYGALGTGHGLQPDIVNFLTMTRKDPAEVGRVREYLVAHGCLSGTL